MNDQWVEFQEENKIRKTNTSACEQINQRDLTLSAGKHAQGITKGHCSGCLVPASKVQNLDHTKGTCDGLSMAQNAAQHKLKL